jgi:hypothetical protein
MVVANVLNAEQDWEGENWAIATKQGQAFAYVSMAAPLVILASAQAPVRRLLESIGVAKVEVNDFATRCLCVDASLVEALAGRSLGPEFARDFEPSCFSAQDLRYWTL